MQTLAEKLFFFILICALMQKMSHSNEWKRWVYNVKSLASQIAFGYSRAKLIRDVMPRVCGDNGENTFIWTTCSRGSSVTKVKLELHQSSGFQNTLGDSRPLPSSTSSLSICVRNETQSARWRSIAAERGVLTAFLYRWKQKEEVMSDSLCYQKSNSWYFIFYVVNLKWKCLNVC